MEQKTLFSITEDQLETGLRGIPVGYCVTSQVHPEKGLSYCGISIKDLAYKDPEEVIFLLLNGHLPDSAQKNDFKKKLCEHSVLDKRVITGLKALPRDGHPMKWFIAGLNFLGMYHNKRSVAEDSFAAIALMPELVAAIYRLRSGWGEPVESKPELGYMENFVHMLKPEGDHPNLVKLMRVFDILHFDHGGGMFLLLLPKLFLRRTSDVSESLIAAMCGLAGPLHGRANQESIAFLKKALVAVKNVDDEGEVYDYIKDIFEKGEKIFGFGHAVLRVEDLRAAVFYELGEEIALKSDLFRLAKTMRQAVPKYLKSQPKISNPYPNVDAASGALLSANGLEDEEYYSVLFGLSRCVGIACQLIYERLQARNGKGTPIIRPKYIYSGPKSGQ